MTVVLDTSAVLAWLRDEPGANVVHPLLPVAVMSAANWSETWQALDAVNSTGWTFRRLGLGARSSGSTRVSALSVRHRPPRRAS